MLWSWSWPCPGLGLVLVFVLVMVLIINLIIADFFGPLKVIFISQIPNTDGLFPCYNLCGKGQGIYTFRIHGNVSHTAVFSPRALITGSSNL